MHPHLHGLQPVDLARLQRVGVRAHQEEAAQLDTMHLALTAPPVPHQLPVLIIAGRGLDHQQQKDWLHALVRRHVLEQHEVAAVFVQQEVADVLQLPGEVRQGGHGDVGQAGGGRWAGGRRGPDQSHEDARRLLQAWAGGW